MSAQGPSGSVLPLRRWRVARARSERVIMRSPRHVLSLPLAACGLLLATLEAQPEDPPPAPEPPAPVESSEPAPSPPAEAPSAPSEAPAASASVEPTEAATPAPSTTAPSDEPEDPIEEPPVVEEPIGDLYDLGAHLFETFAPDEIKERYRFPTREEWDSFAGRLVDALESPSLRKLAEMEPDARAALDALRALPDYEQYADWLEERLDDIAVAQQVAVEAKSEPASPSTSTAEPTPKLESELTAAVPLYDVWLERMRRRPPPVRAAHMVPRLKPVFEKAELPTALVWIAETESSFNPAARSPVGARGLFQLMPGTAKDLGLRLFPFDERLDPVKNATSAARYLSKLHARFDDWPLALAAYNAGPARVSRTLKKHEARSFAEIAEHLPSETRLYVPKVLATIAVREGITPAALNTQVKAASSLSEHNVLASGGPPSTPPAAF